MSEAQLAGKVAIVTGASRRSGAATALRLARQGARVVVHARSSWDKIEAVVADIRAEGGEAVPLLADVTDEQAVGAMVQKAICEFGRVDILINNAAIRPHAPMTSMSFQNWRDVLGVVLDGAFLCTRACLPSMIAQGGGVVINIGGLTGHSGAHERVHVITAKAGLIGLTKAIATEYGDRGIRANCVVPGKIGGIRSATAGRSPRSNLPDVIPLGREGTPEDVAAAVLMLVLPGGSYITGQTLHCNGGLYMP
jgi:3-oxoacyl-[acyl-carrier protein] reductase